MASAETKVTEAATPSLASRSRARETMRAT